MVRAIDAGDGTSGGMVTVTATGDDGNSYDPVEPADYQQPTGGSGDTSTPTTGGGSITDRPTWQVVVAVGAAAYVLGGKL